MGQITVNFTTSTWGHACHIDSKKCNDMIAYVSGHSMKYFDVDDHILFKSQMGSSFGFRYKVIEIKWCDDPHDMFFATCIFANCQTDEDREVDSEGIQSGQLYWDTASSFKAEDLVKCIKDNTGIEIDIKKFIG